MPKANLEPDDHGVPTDMFVAPSEEAALLLDLAPEIADPDETEPKRLGSLVQRFLVAPFTQLTFLSFDLQVFLFRVFHTTPAARVGHFSGMVAVNFFLMVAASKATASLEWVDGGGVVAAGLLCWYAALSAEARMPLWWWAMVPVVVALLVAAHGFLAITAGLDVIWASPWLWLAFSALWISVSHAFEPKLPPRAGDRLKWMTVQEYVLGPDEQRKPLRVRIRNGFTVAIYPFIGAVDELWAAPRLLPYNFLMILFKLGYKPERRAEIEDHAARALAQGNPAIDYVGIGGGTPLRNTKA